MIKTKKLFEDFRKYAIEETGADCAEDEEEVYEEAKEVDEGGPISMGHHEEEPQGNDNPSQDVYAMLDNLRSKVVGTPLEGDVLAIMDKMDANPEMTDTKYPEPPMAEKLSEGKKTIKLKINSMKKK